MARSLRDELLKAGLVTSEQAARAERGRPSAAKPAGGRSAAGNRPPDKTRSSARGRLRDRSGKRSTERTRRGPSTPRPTAPAATPAGPASPDPEERIKQLNLSIRRILDTEAEPAVPESDTPFHFARGERLKRLYVSEEQRRRLAAGELAIAGFGGRHHLLPRQAGERIRELRPEVFVFIATDRTSEDRDRAEEGYEGYEIPDDLVW